MAHIVILTEGVLSRVEGPRVSRDMKRKVPPLAQKRSVGMTIISVLEAQGPSA
jgi:hypothetical protein